MNRYCMSKKSWSNLYSNILYKKGQDFLDRQYIVNSRPKWNQNGYAPV